MGIGLQLKNVALFAHVFELCNPVFIGECVGKMCSLKRISFAIKIGKVFSYSVEFSDL